MAKPKTVSEYIAAIPQPAKKKLKEMRGILNKAAPGATEAIKWGEIGAGPNRKAGAARLRGGVAELFSKKVSVTANELI